MASSAIGTVVSISSTAYARNAEGELRELSAGDVLVEGETVVTPDGGHVELELIDGSPMVVSDMPELLLTRDLIAERTATREESAAEDETIALVLAALEDGTDLGDVLDATAAGNAGGNGAQGSSFYRLGRIVENTTEFSGIGDGSSSAEAIVYKQEEILPVDAVDDESETKLETSVTINVEDNDQFVDGSIVTAVTQAEHGSVVINADDTVTYTPDKGFSGSDTFTYTATSPNGRSADTATVTVKVNGELIPEPEPTPTPEQPLPTLSISDERVVEGDVAEVTVTLSTASAEEVTVSFGSIDESASVVGGDYNAATGEIVFSPGETSKIILIAINDDSLVEDTEQLRVTLSSPVNATIADGEGVVTIVDNDVPDSLPTTPITPPSNNAPSAEDDFKTTSEDTPVVISVLDNDSDSNGDPLNVTIAGDPANGSVVINADSTISYIPNDNFNGEDAFTYSISDGKGGTDTATVNITVTPVTDGFSDDNEVITTEEDTQVSGNVIDGNSVDGPVTVTGFEVDGTAYSAGDTATIPGVGSLQITSTGSYTFTPVANYHGPVPVATYTLSDGVTTDETSTLSLTVTPATDGFSDDNETVSTAEDTPVSGNVIDGSSVDGPVTVTGFEVDGKAYGAGDTATIPGVGSLQITSTGAYTFTPAANYHDSVPVVTYTLSDGVTTDETSTLSLSVTPVTDGFSDNNEIVSTAEDTPVSGNVIDGSSVDGPVTVSGFEIDGTSYGAGDTVIITGVGSLIIGSTGAYTFTPVANYHGSVPVATYTLSDGVTTNETSTLSLSVTPVTDGFSDNNETVSTSEDTSVSGNVIDGSSVDGPVTVTTFQVAGDGTTYSAGDTAAIAGVGSLTINSTGGYTFTPVANSHGPVPVATYTLSDGVTTTETSTLSLTVTPETDGFSDNNETVSTAEDTPVSGNVIDGSSVDGPVTVTGFEIDGTSYGAGDTVIITGVGSLIIGSTGAYTFTPVANYHGPVPVATYTLSDGVTTTETSTLSLTVTPETDGFSDDNETVSTAEDTPVSGNVIDGSSVDGPVTVTGFEVGGTSYGAGDTVIITGVGSLIIGSTGAYTFTPVANYHGPVPVATYTLSDGVTTTETSTLSLTVTPETDGFSDNNEVVTTAEDTPVSGNVIDGSSVDGPVTVTGFEVGGTSYGAGDTVIITGVGSLIIGSTGAYTFTPVPNYHGPVPVATYTLSDGVTTTETSTLSLTVTPVTDGFSDNNETVITAEDTSVSGNVIDGSSVDGPVTVTGFEINGSSYGAGDTATITSVGSLTINSTGGYTFTPIANYHGPVPVATYTLSDGVTTTETSTLSLTVTPETDGFTDNDETISTAEDTPVSGNVIDGSSVDGPVTVTGFEVDGTSYGAGDTAAIAGVGSLTINSTGGYAFTPVANYHGPVPVATYTLSDGVTTDETSTLSLTVTPVTDGFTDNNETVSTAEDTPVSGNVIDGTSVDGPVTVTGFEVDGTSYGAGDTAAIAGVGSLTINSTGGYAFTPVANYHGPVPVATYTLSDGVTTDETSTLSLTVTPVTDGFSDNNETVITAEDTPVSGNVIDGSSVDGPVTVTGFEIDGTSYGAGDTVIITGVGSLIIGSTGAYTFTPVANYHGPVPVATYTLSDGVTTDETSTLSLTVTPVTDGFSDNNEVVSTAEDTPVSGNVVDGSSVDGPVTVTGFEVDGTSYGAGDTVIITGVGSLIIGSTGAYTFTPVANYHGPVPVATYTLSDGVTTTETSTLSLAVTPVTDGFTDNDETVSTAEDTPVSGNVIDGTSVDGPVTVTGFEVDGTAYGTGDTAAIAGVGSLTINSTGGYTFTPVANYHGPVPVATYTLSDGVTTTETSTLSLTVTPVTDGFSDNNETVITAEDTSVSGNVIDGSSVDGPVTVSGFEVDGNSYGAGDTATIPGVGSLQITSTGDYTFTPVANYHGPVPVATYTLSDGVTTDETSTLSLTVTPVTDGFSDNNEVVSTAEDTPVSGNVVDGSSVDGPVTVTGFEVDGTSYGAGDTVIITGVGSLIIGSTGAYTFTPVANYHGPVPVATYTLSDSVTTTETSTLSLTVTPETDGFTDNDETVSTAEDTPVSGNLIDGSSVDGPVTLTGFEVDGTSYGAGDTATIAGVGSLTINSTGGYTFAPVANYHGSVPVATYTLSDGVTTTETSTLSLTVTPVTDGFTDNNETVSTAEDTPVSGNVIDGTSVDGPVTVTGFEVDGTAYGTGDTASIAGVGSLQIGSTGAYTFTPVANYHGPVPVTTYTLSDGVTTDETSTLSLTVTPVTDGFSDNNEVVSTAEDTPVSGNVVDGSSVDGPVTVTTFQIAGDGTTYSAGDTAAIVGVGSLTINSTGGYTFAPVANYHGPVPVATYTLSDGVTTDETSTLSLTVTPVTDGFSDNNETVSTAEDTPVSGNVIDGTSVDGPVTVTGFEVDGTSYGAGDTAAIAGVGSLTINSTGGYTFTPVANYHGPVPVATYTLSDGVTTTETSTLSLTVTPETDGFTDNDETASTAEDTPVSGNVIDGSSVDGPVTVTGFEVDGNSYGAGDTATIPGVGSLQITSTGAYTFTPAANYHGPVPVATYTLSDGVTTDETSTLSLSVTPVTDGFSDNNEAVSTAEDTPVSGNVIDGTSVDGPVTVTAFEVDGNSYGAGDTVIITGVGSLIIGSTGAYTFTPAANYHGPVPVATYTLSDGVTTTETSTLSLTVTPVTDGFSDNNETVITAEDTPVSGNVIDSSSVDGPVTVTGFEIDGTSYGAGDTVIITGVGSLIIGSTGAYTFTPVANYHGPVPVATYTLSDGVTTDETSTLSLTVTPVTDGFSDNNETVSTAEDTPVGGNVIDGTSVDGPVTVTGFEVDGTAYGADDTATIPGVGSLQITSTGGYTFTPAANYHGPVPVATYTLSDGVTTTETSTLSLTVTPVTDGFSDNNETVITAEDTPVSGNVIDGSSVDGPVTVTGFEIDGTSYGAGDTVIITGVGSLIIGSTGAYTFTPVANYHGPVPVATYTLSDGVTTDETSTLSLTVTPVTDGFSDNNETVSTAEDTPVSGNVIDGSSVDGPVTVTDFEIGGTSYGAGDTAAIPVVGSLQIGSTGAYTFTPTANYHGPVPVVTYTLSDGVTTDETSTLSLTVTPVTDGFSDDNETVSTAEDTSVSGNVIDGSSVDGPVTVTGFEIDGTSYGAGDTVIITGVGSLIIGSTGAYTFTPAANYHGSVPVATYTLSDGVTTTETSTLSLTVTPVTDGFSDNNETVSTAEDTSVSGNVIDGSSVDGPVTVTGFEIDGTSYGAGDTVIITGVGSLIIGSTGAYTFTPAANYHGSVPVATYTLSDGVTTNETSTLSLSVTPVTDGFSDNNETVSTAEDTSVSGNVIDGSSVDGPVTVTTFQIAGDGTTYSAGDTAAIAGVGSLTINSAGGYTFAPVANYHGPVPVATYTLSDGVTTDETSTLSLTVTPVTDGFSDNSEVVSTAEDTPVSGNVIDGTSVDGPVTVTGFEIDGTSYGAGDTVIIPGVGSLIIGSTGAYTFTPVANYHGPVPVATYTLSDGVTTTETSTLSLTVTPETDGFSDNDEVISTSEDTPVSGNVIDGTSVDGPVMVTGFEIDGTSYGAGDTVIITGVGSLIIGSTGAYTFTPVANYHGPVPVATYTLSDSVTTTETSTLSLTVTPETDGFTDNDETVSTAEDTPVSGNLIDGSSVDGPVTLTGFEVDGTSYGAGDTATIAGVGSLTINSTGGYAFAPVANYHGSVPVATYTLSDGVTTTETSTLSLTVTPVTDGFTDNNETVSTAEDTPVSGNVIDGTSVDGPVTVTGFEVDGTAYGTGDTASIAGVGSLQIGSTGAYTFTPVANYHGPVPVTTYTLSDGVTTDETSTLSLTVTPVTDGFSDNNEVVSTAEDTPVSGNVVDGSSVDGPVTVTTFQIAGDGTTYSAGDTAAIVGVGSLTINSTGGYTFAPVANYHGPVPVATYTLSDGVTTDETSTLSLTVTPVTDGFSDDNETVSTAEDTSVSGNVIDGSSVDGPVTVTGFEVDGTSYGAGDTAAIAGVGSLTINSTGGYTFTPVANYHGPVPVATYTLSDGVTTTETSTLSLTVTPETDGFTDNDETASTAEDTPVSGNVIDGSSVDGPVTVTGFEVDGNSYGAGDTATIPGVGSLQITSTGAYTFTPAANYHGPVPVATYTLSDGVTTTETSTLSLTVTPETDGFSDNNEVVTTAEDTPVSGNVIDGSSVDGPVTVTTFQIAGDGTTYSAGDTAAIVGVGSLTINSTGGYTFAPVANYHGPVPVATYTLSDGVTTDETSTLSLSVNPVTDGFSDNNETVSTAEDTPVSGNVIDGSSVDGPVTVTGFEVDGTAYGAHDTATIPGVGSLQITSTGGYTFTPAANYHGPVPVATYTLSDGVTTTETSTLSLTVTPVTDGFSDNNETVITAEDTPVSGNVIDGSSVDGPVTVTGFEIDGTSYGAGDTVIITGVGSLIIGSTGAYTFTPVANYHGPVPVATYTLSDGVSTTETSTLSLTVAPVTDGFTDNNETVSTAEDTPVSGNVIDATSVDGPVTVTGFEVDGTTYGAGDTAAIAGVGSLTINSTGGYAFTPVANYHGPVPVATYTLSDGVTTNETSTLSLTVTPVTDGFTDNNETVSTVEDTPVSGNVIDGTSVDGPVTVTGFEVDGNNYGAGDTAAIAGVGSLTINSTGGYTFTPVANYHGSVPVATYTLSDGVTTNETSTLSLSVTPVTDGFSDNNETVSTAEDTPVSGNVIDGSSVDGPVTVTGFEVGGTSYGAGDTVIITGVGSLIIGSTGAYTFTPVANYHGPVPVATYTLSDGVTTTETSTLSLTVTPVTDGFSDNNETVSTAEDTPVSGNVIDGSSVDGPVTVTGFEVDGTSYGAGDTAAIAGVGSLTINSTGGYTFTPVANYHGPVPVATYTLSDGVTTTETSTLSLTVTPVTDGFTDNDETVSTAEDTPVSGNVIDGTSVDGPVTVTGFEVDGTAYGTGDTAAIAGVGSLTINSTGGYTFTPVANYHGPVPVATYTLSDGVTTTETSTLSLTVTPVTDGFSDNNEVVSTAEDTPVSGNVIDGSSVDGPVTVTGFEVDGTDYIAGDTATITGVGVLTIDSTGAYTFTPVASYNGPVPVSTYTLSDGVTTTETSTLSITVTPDSFSDNNEFVSTEEDTRVRGNVVDGSSNEGPVTVTTFEVAGDGATYSAGDTATIAGVGTLTIGSGGDYTFRPARNYNGPVPVATYKLSDGVTTATSTLSLTVTPVGDNFSDRNERVTTAEDTPLSGNVIDGVSVDGPITVTTFQVAGDGTTYSAGDTATMTGVGTVTIGSTGDYTFTPAADYIGRVPVVTYSLSDGSDPGDTSNLSIRVIPGADGFSDDNESLSTPEDTPVSGNVIDGSSPEGPITVTGFDVDGTAYNAGDAATITGVGTLTIDSTGDFTFTPVANYTGPVPVATYTLSDGVTTDETSTLSLTVTPETDGFSDNDEVISTSEDTPVSGNVIDGSSVDGPVTVTGFEIGGTSYGAGDTVIITGVGSLIIGSTGAYTFTPVANYHGPVPVATYTLSDGVTTDETSTLSLTVTPVTDGFSDNNETVITAEDTSVSGNVIDGSSVDGPVTVTTFQVAGDGTTYSAGDTAAIAGVGSLTINSTGGYTFTPVANYHGSVPVATYTLSDGVTTTETSTLSLTVTPETDGFTDNDETISTAEDTPVSGNVIDGSSDEGPVIVTTFQVAGDGATYTAGDTATITGVGTLTIGSTGGYTFTPEANYSGVVPEVTYSLSDGTDPGDTSKLFITVTPIADVPTASVEIGGLAVVDTSEVVPIGVTLGSTKGDDVIDGTEDFDYDETVSTLIDLGAVFAGATVNVELDISVGGSWNQDGDGGYFDDNWGMSVNGAPTAVFFYNSDNTSIITTEDLGGGVTGYRHGTPGNANQNINFNHKPVVPILLDENGQADLVFGAQTTSQSEVVTINGLELDPPDIFEYSVDLSAALSDLDNSEVLSVVVNGPVGGTLFSNTPDILVTKVADGQWSIESVPAGSLSMDIPASDLTFSVLEGTVFDLEIVVTATDTDGASGAITVTDNTGVIDGDMIDGQLIDGIVAGLDYTTSSGLSGQTDEQGNFSFMVGDTITFSIGNIVLGSVSSEVIDDGIVFLQEIAGVGLQDLNNDYVENMAVFLQSLDNNGDAYNGIVISDDMHQAFSDENFDLATISKEGLQEVLLDNGLTPVSEDDAMQHVKDMLMEHAGVTGFDERTPADAGAPLMLDAGEDAIIITLNDEVEAENDSAPNLLDSGGDVVVFALSEEAEADNGVSFLAVDQAAGDTLDLSDLLLGEEAEGADLTSYLNVSFDGTDTIIKVSTAGEFTGSANDSSIVDQTFTLEGVDLVAGNGLETVIQDMLSSGKLIVDQ